GYRVTSMMLAEAAVVLATSPKEIPDVSGGILTPATALGAPYRDALHAHGMKYSYTAYYAKQYRFVYLYSRTACTFNSKGESWHAPQVPCQIGQNTTTATSKTGP